MDSITPNQEPTVVQRWLQKLVEANKEYEKSIELIREKNRAKRKPPKKLPETKKKVSRVVMPEIDKSKEAKEESQRRQQNKGKGFVYLMRSGNGYYKIGISKFIKNRLSGLRRQFPVEIDPVHVIASDDYRRVEKFLHKKYSAKRAQHEWFNLDLQDVQWITSLRDYDLD